MISMTDTTTTCPVHGPGCRRLHVGDRVQVVHSPTQVGYGQTGTVVADTDSGHFTVRFDVPATVTVTAHDTGMPVQFSYPELTYSEHELDKTAVPAPEGA